jgi:hypothetical protein
MLRHDFALRRRGAPLRQVRTSSTNCLSATMTKFNRAVYRAAPLACEGAFWRQWPILVDKDCAIPRRSRVEWTWLNSSVEYPVVARSARVLIFQMMLALAGTAIEHSYTTPEPNSAHLGRAWERWLRQKASSQSGNPEHCPGRQWDSRRGQPTTAPGAEL